MKQTSYTIDFVKIRRLIILISKIGALRPTPSQSSTTNITELLPANIGHGGKVSRLDGQNIGVTILIDIIISAWAEHSKSFWRLNVARGPGAKLISSSVL